MSAPAKIQALEALVEAHARELHLPAIRQRFRALAAEALREQQTPLAYLAALLEAEVTERAERREKRRLLDARFPLIKRLEDFRFDERLLHKRVEPSLLQGWWEK
jgi:DNA replication protein DnaC